MVRSLSRQQSITGAENKPALDGASGRTPGKLNQISRKREADILDPEPQRHGLLSPPGDITGGHRFHARLHYQRFTSAAAANSLKINQTFSPPPGTPASNVSSGTMAAGHLGNRASAFCGHHRQGKVGLTDHRPS